MTTANNLWRGGGYGVRIRVIEIVYFTTSGERGLFRQESCLEFESQDDSCKSMNTELTEYIPFH